MKHTRTPYDIRLELLILATQILNEKHRAQAQTCSSTYINPGTSPTTDEIIAEAKKLNDFVSNTHT